MGYDEYQAEGIAETDVKAVAIPRQVFDQLIATSGEFRRFVFTAFSQRITNLFQLIEEVAFSRIDVRLADRLLALADDRGHLAVTHQQLAAELGTAREVISRVIGEFQRRGWLSGSRGTVQIENRAGLETLARSR
jgi:CRP/FNR family transcriptional regulator